ncbi:MAG: ABC transporter substrate-binding protein [Acetobacteraceae bacterium]
MSVPDRRQVRKASRRQVIAGAGGLAGLAALPAMARAAPQGAPIKIGIIAEASSIDGAPIPKGAEMAVDAINAKGGVLGRPLKLVVYDDHFSSSDAVRAFQRLATEDKVSAVIGSFVSEVALALMPWSARLKMPYITPGAASDNISKEVHDNYDRYKYTFLGWLNSFQLAKSVSDSAHDILVDQLHMKTCAIMSEDAAWTTSLDEVYLEFLPKAGLTVVDHIRFSPNTTDFTPIFNKIEAKKPDVIITGMAHVGVVPTVQWAESHVPIPMYGVNSQASQGSFWKDTHGQGQGVITQAAAGPDSAITPFTVPFTNDYTKRFGILPNFTGYCAYDMTHVITDAITRANSTDPDKLVPAMQATDLVGTLGRIKFYGREDLWTHALEYGPGLILGVMVQWQNARMKTIWPVKFANAKITFPSFVKLPT